MKNKEIRKIAKENLKGKLGKAIGITFLYYLLTAVVGGILGMIPYIGAILSFVISVPLAFGYVKHLIEHFNGEEVGLVDFFKHSFENFKNIWCSTLLIALKCIVSFIVIGVGIFLLLTVNEVMGFVVIAGAAIWMLIVFLNYCMLNYTLAYNPELKTKELLNKTSNDSKGLVWKFICMGIYYGLQIFACTFIITLLTGVIGGILGNAAIALLLGIASAVLIAYFVLKYSIENVVACNEFYKHHVISKESQETADMNNNIIEL